MRIAFVCGKFPKISETFILHQITGLLDAGHEIDIYALRHPDEPPEHQIIEEYDLRSRTTYLNAPSTYPEATKQIITNCLKGRELSWETLRSISRGPAGGDRIAALDAFADIEEYDLVHAHFGTVGKSVDFLGNDLPLLVSFYGSDVSRTLRENPDAYQGLWDDVAGVTALSFEMKEQLVASGCPEELIHIVPLPIDLSRISFNPSTLEPTINISTIARFVEKKGLEYALKAVDSVSNQYEINYQIAGDGPLRNEIENLIREYSLEDSVELLGWQTQAEINQLLGESHIFLLPSRTARSGDKEGTPTVLLETQAAGVPPVSTYHAGIPEIVEHNRRGLLCPPLSAEKLEDRIVEMINRKQEWGEMAEAGRQYVESEHSQEAVVGQLESVYKRVS